ncbi:MAG: hypothetical protein ABIJ65_11835 [Chloroflexota bacterium]
MTGNHNLLTGEIDFTYKTSAHYPNFMNVSIEYYGNGTFTGNQHAEGSANFTAVCNSIGEELNCTNTVGGETIRRKTWTIEGRVPWIMDFTP